MAAARGHSPAPKALSQSGGEYGLDLSIIASQALLYRQRFEVLYIPICRRLSVAATGRRQLAAVCRGRSPPARAAIDPVRQLSHAVIFVNGGGLGF